MLFQFLPPGVLHVPRQLETGKKQPSEREKKDLGGEKLVDHVKKEEGRSLEGL